MKDEETVDELNIQLKEVEEKLRQQEEATKSAKHEIKKQEAIHHQKMEFLQVQLEETKSQLQEAYRQQERMMQAIKDEERVATEEDDPN